VLKREYDTQVCSIARALEVVGERWSLLILRSVFLGIYRFDELLEDLGITRSVLTARLNHLVAEGVLERVPYQQRPVRYEYKATEKGWKLLPAIVHLMRWGDEYYPDPLGKPRIIEHADCGGAPDDNLLCDRCGVPVGHGNVVIRPGAPLLARQG
jgi:DNA-binding HxlR family transcriptional regulator